MFVVTLSSRCPAGELDCAQIFRMVVEYSSRTTSVIDSKLDGVGDRMRVIADALNLVHSGSRRVWGL